MKAGLQIPVILLSPDRSRASSPFRTYRQRLASPPPRSPKYYNSLTSTDRFECLYSNAMTSKRFQEQNRRQAERFKEKHATDGCTFNPRFMSRSYTPKQLTPRPREMATMNKVVERMRRASVLREEQLKYTRLRTGTNAPPRIASAPFSFGDGRQYDVGARLREDREKRVREKPSNPEEDPAVIVEVAGDDGEFLGKLTLRKTDDLRSVVSRFCDTRGLAFEYESRLLKRLKKLSEDDSVWPREVLASETVDIDRTSRPVIDSSLPPPFDHSLKPATLI